MSAIAALCESQLPHIAQVPLVPIRELLRDSQNGLSKRHGDTGEPVPVLRLANIIDGAIDESDVRDIRLTDKEIAKYVLQPGDLLCIRVNGSRNLVGRVVPFTAQRRWAHCDHFIRLRPDQTSVDSRYLAHYLNTRVARRQIELNMVSSAGQNTVSQGTMLDLSVPLPDLATQRAIVAELEKQFSRLDEAVANLKRVGAGLARYKAATLTEAFAAQPTWAVSSYGEIGVVTTGSTPPTTDSANFGGAIPFIKPTDLDAGDNVVAAREHLSHQGMSKGRPLPENSVLVTCIGATIGKTGLARVACATNQQINAVSPDPSKVDARFLYWWTVSPPGQRQIISNASATTLPILNKSKFSALVVPLPPISEQRCIVSEVDRRLSIVRGVEVEVDANLKRAQALRQAVLARAFAKPIEPGQ